MRYIYAASLLCMLQAWPWSPDTLAMSTWIAAEENEPDALAMLAGAARQPGVSTLHHCACPHEQSAARLQARPSSQKGSANCAWRFHYMAEWLPASSRG